MKLSQSGGGRGGGGGGGGQKRKRKAGASNGRAAEDSSPEAVEHSLRVKEALRKGLLRTATTSYGEASPKQREAERRQGEGEEEDGEWEEAYAGMTLSKQILKSDGLDIVKKGHQRKNRYLLVFSGWLQVAKGSKAGKLGTLKDVDTQNPSLCIDFPKLGGTLKMLGTIVFPSTKCAVLNFEAKKQIVIDEIFDSMIVFSKANWIKWPTEAASGMEIDTNDAAKGVEFEGLPTDVIEKLEREVQQGAKEEEGEDYRCGATTGEPKAVQVKKETKKNKFQSVLETFNQSEAALVGDDLEELDTEEEFEIDYGGDTAGAGGGESDSDGSDESFRVGAKKRKQTTSRAKAKAKPKPKPKPKPRSRSKAISVVQRGGVKKRSAKKEVKMVDLVSEEEEDEDDGSDWSGMD